MTTVEIDAAATAAVTAVLAVMFAVTAVLAWAWEHRRPSRRPSRLARFLAEAERARVDAIMADPALWEDMERRVQQ